jgi:hypothetical protein
MEPHSQGSNEPLSEGARIIALTAGAAAIGSLAGPEGTVVGAVLGALLALLAAAERHREEV